MAEKMGDEEKNVKSPTFEYITLKVLSSDNTIFIYRIKKNTPIGRLIDVYCDQEGISAPTFRIRFNGEPVNYTDTATSLGMEEDDIIEIYQPETGGNRRRLYQ